ncbi:MAG: indolepyruvate ferredoxin oxidoreductase subunit alpha [Treponema sp.]|jgi:indolepyruvate ferredoxin oxidoreductase alpha subunit|nr:indolepyruvate ferredoxin oxidoreductase subunit alpha [Treponema sp.]
MSEQALLGDEAVALGAIHAGASSAYGYPGTPSTEIMEYLLQNAGAGGRPLASWCANEKTAYEEALGASYAGRRVLVTMKHVGLNVAADPFVNSALLDIHGGFVLAVADDPGMHSSQNEQDSRFYAEYAKIICLEPANQQEAYDMTREAFDVSERFHIPVMLRLTTRISHSRAGVAVSAPRGENPVIPRPDSSGWVFLPARARLSYRRLLEKQKDILAYSEASGYNSLNLNSASAGYGVITTGLGRNYYLENSGDLAEEPPHLHIGVYPLPVEKIRRLAASVKKLVIIEEGMPAAETAIRGVLPAGVEIRGKLDGFLPPDGELDPDIVRGALGLEKRARVSVDIQGLKIAARPPQLCAGCPHGDTYALIKNLIGGLGSYSITADIGCYSLGAAPPYSIPETIVCMGASIGMAKGAAEAGVKNAIAVIGDSTFLHSGLTALIDAAARNTPMTLIILDNGTVAMTGTQETILPSRALVPLIRGIGVDPDHIITIEAHRKNEKENSEILRREVAYPGLSVIIAARECLEAAKSRMKRRGKDETAGGTV